MASLVSVNDGSKSGFVRPIASFPPDIWGHKFLSFSPEKEEIRIKKEREHKVLKNDLRNQLLGRVGKPLEYLELVNLLERLGVAYHFENETEATLRQIYDSNKEITENDKDLDLYHTSLKFRILRQHHFYTTSDVFKRFLDNEGNLLESLKEDVKSMLCLYEAAHLRMHGEDVLERALAFTKKHLTNIVEQQSNHPLATQVARAIKYPIQKGVLRLESRHYISFYEQDPCRVESTLRFAKLDFNFLQSMYKEELTKWKQRYDHAGNFPFVRDRVVEAHFFSVGTYFQPQFSTARKIYTKAFIMLTILDDIYDAFGTIEELEAFNEAIQRWDKSCIHQLPSYMKEFCGLLYDTLEEFEDQLVKLGRKSYVDSARNEVISLSRAYLKEAKWREAKYIPTFEEYRENALRSCGISFVVTVSFLDNEVEESVARKSLEVVSIRGKPQRAACITGRFMNDIVDYEWDKQREHVAGLLDCYMKQYSVTKEEACTAMNVAVEDAWKDLAEEMFLPTTPIPMPLLTRIHNLCRICNYVYKYEDAFTLNTQRMMSTLTLLFVEPLR